MYILKYLTILRKENKSLLMKTLLIFVFTLNLNMSCGHTNNKQQSVQPETEKQIPVAQQTPENKPVEKYGFQFQIPEQWQVQSEDFETKNLKGEVKTVESGYKDTSNNSSIRLIYHPGNAGMTLYRYYFEDTSGDVKKVKIGRQEALQKDEVLTRDGKGHLLSVPFIRHKIYIVAPEQKGVLEVVYTLPKNDVKAGKVYHDFVNNIKPVG